MRYIVATRWWSVCLQAKSVPNHYQGSEVLIDILHEWQRGLCVRAICIIVEGDKSIVGHCGLQVQAIDDGHHGVVCAMEEEGRCLQRVAYVAIVVQRVVELLCKGIVLVEHFCSHEYAHAS